MLVEEFEPSAEIKGGNIIELVHSSRPQDRTIKPLRVVCGPDDKDAARSTDSA